MNTQTPSVHIRHWHKEFWLLAIANLLVCMSVYMYMPLLPEWLLLREGLTVGETAWAIGLFAVGLYLPGPVCSFLVQHYRRNMVCVLALFLLSLMLFVLYGSLLFPEHCPPAVVWIGRLLTGSAFGLATLVLNSTLIIDTSDSSHRTEANHAGLWFSRMAVVLGPLSGLLVYRQFGMYWVMIASVACGVAAALIVLSIRFPFRVPTGDVSFLSLDRFFLPFGWPLFAFLIVGAVGIGLVLSVPSEPEFYGFLAVGLLLSMLSERYVFREAELKSELVTASLLLGGGALMMVYAPASALAPLLFGIGLGIFGARCLLFFIKLSHHCQRGTSQSTFILGWESGICIGYAIGCLLVDGNRETALHTAAVLFFLLLMAYHFYLHAWFLKHKNR